MPNQPSVAKRGEVCPRCGQIHERCLAHAKKIHGGSYADGIKPCGNQPIKGGHVCETHGGAATQVRERALERRALENATAELVAIGYPIDIEPGEALLEQVREAAGNVAFLRDKVQELEAAETGDGRGVIGKDHAGDQAAHIWYNLYSAERDRLTSFAKLAIAAGVAERQVQIAERQGALVADLVRKLLDDPELGLTPAQRQKGRVIAAGHLRLVS